MRGRAALVAGSLLLLQGSSLALPIGINALTGDGPSVLGIELSIAGGAGDHAPIIINGDAELLLGETILANGVVGGKGTADDPFRISGWKITARSQDGIIVLNTRLHLAISDNTILDGKNTGGRYRYSAIVLGNAENVTVERNALTANYHGIMLRENVGATIRLNVIRESEDAGISGFDSRSLVEANTIGASGSTAIEWDSTSPGTSSLTVSSNTLRANEGGVRVNGAEPLVVSGNTIEDNSGAGVSTSESHEATIEDNRIADNGDGMMLHDSTGRVAGNDVSGSSTGVLLDGGSFLVESNSVHDNERGLAIAGGSHRIAKNDIFDNSDAGAVGGGDSVILDRNWWGTADGPSGTGGGHGDRITGAGDSIPYEDEPLTPPGKARGNTERSAGYGPATRPTPAVAATDDIINSAFDLAPGLLAAAALALWTTMWLERRRRGGPQDLRPRENTLVAAATSTSTTSNPGTLEKPSSSPAIEASPEE